MVFNAKGACAETLKENDTVTVTGLVYNFEGFIEFKDATLKMKELKQTLDAIIEYAGCDPSVTKCTGPKRVKKFKDMANEFFDPYEGVLESMYDALVTAITVGIDVSDVVMLLSDSCNMWGKFLCDPCSLPKAKKDGQAEDYGHGGREELYAGLH